VTSAQPKSRDWFWVEAGSLVATLVGGAVLRYWLSTVVPFDPGEVAVLEDASDPDRAMRVPFIMMNGISLFVLYVVVRRSAGVGAAFATELALQASLVFQLEALRIRMLSAVVLLALFVIAYVRLYRPSKRLPRRVDRILLGIALFLSLRQLQLLVTLPGRMAEIRRESRADVASLAASVAACGGERELTLERLPSCPIAWPTKRSLEQQESLWEHQRRLGKDAVAVPAAAAVPPSGPGARVAILDARGAGFIVVPEGPLATTARRVISSAER
jgi:hypothetical protein